MRQETLFTFIAQTEISPDLGPLPACSLPSPHAGRFNTKGSQRKRLGMPAQKKLTAAKRGPGSDDDFVYKTDAGDTITVPSMANLFKTAGELRRMRSKPPIEVAMFVIERDCSPEELQVFDALSMDEFNRFSELWGEHSGVDAGESSAS